MTAAPSVPSWLRTLPDGRTISALGFGCSSIWASPNYDDAAAAALLDAVAADGVNHFDTGPSYGNGLGERRLGAWLAKRDRTNMVLATKVGTNLIDGRIVRSFEPADMARSFEDSLERLGVDRVDFLYLHGPSVTDLSVAAIDFLEQQKAAGRVVWTGVNSFSPAVLDRVVGLPIDAVMLQYNVGDFRNARQMDALHAAGKIVMSGTALARARFALRSYLPRNRARLWYLMRLLKDDPLAPLNGLRLARRMARSKQPLAETAIQFVTGQPRITSSLFGTSNAAHAHANIRAGLGSLDPRLWQELAAG